VSIAELLAEALVLHQQEPEDERGIEQLGAKYGQLLPGDELLVSSFEHRFSETPEDFAPLET
jgi:hypothetical protein